MTSLAARATYQSLLLIGAVGLVLLVGGGSWRFWQAWLYLAVATLAIAAITVYLLIKDPVLLERRLALGEKGEAVRGQLPIQMLAAASFLAMLLVCGLEWRWAGPAIPGAAVVAADALVALAFLVLFFVFRVNSYASAIIEVGAEQSVITEGPYRLVRHPMYGSALLLIVATPLALGTPWGELLVVPLIGVLVARVRGEERFLAAHLNGYVDYMNKTRYRLIPRIW
jgi:protein-S-isoprenylcysteine O-methyltransferase Ste14